MRWQFPRPRKLLLPASCVAALLVGYGARADEKAAPPAAAPPAPPDAPRSVTPDPALRLAQAEAGQPVQPTQPTQPTVPTAAPTAGATGAAPVRGLFGATGPSTTAEAPQAAPSAAQTSLQAAPSVDTVGGAQATVRQTADVGDLLVKSPNATGVEAQSRSPVVSDTRIRGYRVGQFLTVADGGLWFPARLDLDTVLSKFDSHLINNVVVIKGPYSVRYGPGFGVIDITTLGAPRYENGWEVHGSTAAAYKTNGDQFRARQSFWGGEQTWGFRVGYDLMLGTSNYDAGNGQDEPSRYGQRALDVALGFDLSCDSRLDLRFMHVNQQPVELPALLADINKLISDGYTARYVLENQPLFDRLTVDAWYNYTRFGADNLRPSKRVQIPLLNNFFNNPAFPPVPLFLQTEGDTISRGFREVMTWGKDKEPQLSFGVDLSYLSHYINEFDTFTLTLGDFTFSRLQLFPEPRDHQVDPGLFLDASLPLTNSLLLRAGARTDFVSAQIERFPPNGAFNFNQAQYLQIVGQGALTTRHFDLWSAFATGEYKLNDHWTALGGYGFGQRPPFVTELYAFKTFLGVIQNGFNYVLGNADLSAEQAHQLDISLRADYERFRLSLNGFYAWIHNYITYELVDPQGKLIAGGAFGSTPLRGLRYLNTDLATLSGAEAYCEWDVLDWLTPFGTLSYVEGRDYTRNGRDASTLPPPLLPLTPASPRGGVFGPAQEPLPQIPPIESRLGFRVHQAGKSPRWAVEISARVVGPQDRVAETLTEVATPGFTTYDLRTYWQVNKGLLLTAGVENFTDKTYREHLDLRTPGLGFLQPGINFYFGAKMDY
jgi:outer membrane receptor protein involved in Fe transport